MDAVSATGGAATALTTNLVFLSSSTDLSGGNNYRLGYVPATGISNPGRLVLR